MTEFPNSSGDPTISPTSSTAITSINNNIQSSNTTLSKTKKTHSIIPTSGLFVPFKKGTTLLNAGIVHLYRERKEVEGIENLDQTDVETHIPQDPQSSEFSKDDKGSGNILSVLAVPSYLTAQDFINFIGSHSKHVSHIRIVRDSLPNRYMVLMNFKNSKYADSFYRQFSGRHFSSLDPGEICHVVHIKSIEFKSKAIRPYAFSSNLYDMEDSATSVVSNNVNTAVSPIEHHSIPSNLIELPNCPGNINSVSFCILDTYFYIYIICSIF